MAAVKRRQNAVSSTLLLFSGLFYYYFFSILCRPLIDRSEKERDKKKRSLQPFLFFAVYSAGCVLWFYDGADPEGLCNKKKPDDPVTGKVHPVTLFFFIISIKAKGVAPHPAPMPTPPVAFFPPYLVRLLPTRVKTLNCFALVAFYWGLGNPLGRERYGAIDFYNPP